MTPSNLASSFNIQELSIHEDETSVEYDKHDIVIQNGKVFRIVNSGPFKYLKLMKSDPSKIVKDNKIISDELTLISDDSLDYKVDGKLLSYVMKYFQNVFEKFKCESCVLLMLNKHTKDWRVVIPPQLNVSGTSVTYLTPVSNLDSMKDDKNYDLYETVFENEKSNKLMKIAYEEYAQNLKDGYFLYGTIHSHCDFSAFHSGVDDADEANFNGLHITIGNVNDKFTFSARYMIEGESYPLDIDDAVSMKDVLPDLSVIKIKDEHMESIIVGFSDEMSDNESSLDEIATYEDSSYRIYDIEEDRVFWVSIDNYNINLELFTNGNYRVLPDPIIDAELDSTLMDVPEPLTEQEDILPTVNPFPATSSDDESIKLFNVPSISGTAKEPVLTSNVISDASEYLKKYKEAYAV